VVGKAKTTSYGQQFGVVKETAPTGNLSLVVVKLVTSKQAFTGKDTY